MASYSQAIALALMSAALVAPARAEDNGHGIRRSVREFGAICDGRHDDTHAFKAAVAAAASGGMLHVPAGKCILNDTIVIKKNVSIVGTGFASQIYGNSDKTLFQLQGTTNTAIRDLYLGSRSSAPGVSLIKMLNAHRNQINNVTLLGGYYGVHLYGSLLNTFIDLRSGTNFGGFFGATSTNRYWVYAETDPSGITNPAIGRIAANANTFVAPVLEGGTNGIWLDGGGDQGSLTILGGTIEGVTGQALTFKKTFLSSSVTGTHFEANRVADVVIEDSSNIRLSSIVSVPNPTSPDLANWAGINIIDHPVSGLYSLTRNIQVSDSMVEKMSIPASAKRILLQNITTGVLNGTGPAIGPGSPHIDVQNGAATVTTNIGLYSNGQ
jgi:hypothetical protein